METFKAHIFPGEDGYFVAEVIGLPGCISQGRTRAEALANIKEALEGILESIKEHGDWRPSAAEHEVRDVTVEV